MLRWQSYWKIVKKGRKMSCGSELFLRASFFPLRLPSADGDVLQRGKLISSIVFLLFTGAQLPCSTACLLLKQTRQQNSRAFLWGWCTASLGGKRTNRLGLKRPLWVANGLGAQLEDGRWSFPLPARAVGSGFLSAGLPRDGEAELAVVCTVLSQVFE